MRSGGGRQRAGGGGGGGGEKLRERAKGKRERSEKRECTHMGKKEG